MRLPIVLVSVALCACNAWQAHLPHATDPGERDCAANALVDHASVRAGRSAVRDSVASSAASNRLEVVVTDSASDTVPVRAAIRLRGRDSVTATTDRTGRASLLVQNAGRYELSVRGIGYRQSTDSIVVRAGYADTLYVALHAARVCVYRDVF